MFLDQMLTAIILITCPVYKDVDFHKSHIMQFYLRGVISELDIMEDKWDISNYFIIWNGDMNYYWRQDIIALRARYENIKDSPPFSDSIRWKSSYKNSHEYQLLTIKHLEWLKTRRTWISPYQLAEWEAWNEETMCIYKAWDYLIGIQNLDNAYLVRQSMKELRALLGDRAYYAAEMPPPVPFWRFREINEEKRLGSN